MRLLDGADLNRAPEAAPVRPKAPASRDLVLRTQRLSLRPTMPADAGRAIEIQSDWQVTRMLRMATFPPEPATMSTWFADHEREWLSGEAYRFAVLEDEAMIGVVDLDEIAGQEGDLGYWLDRNAWGRGYAYEAASEVVRFAFSQASLVRLRSGHATDNPASGRILEKLGFQRIGLGPAHSRSRGGTITQASYLLERPGQGPSGDSW